MDLRVTCVLLLTLWQFCHHRHTCTWNFLKQCGALQLSSVTMVMSPPLMQQLMSAISTTPHILQLTLTETKHHTAACRNAYCLASCSRSCLNSSVSCSAQPFFHTLSHQGAFRRAASTLNLSVTSCSMRSAVSCCRRSPQSSADICSRGAVSTLHWHRQ
jgi:hypothetical protein